MSKSHGTLRHDGSGKENRKRTNPTEIGRGNSTSWQITSNSRCLACGRLATMCDCDKGQIDPQVKRLRLDTFLLNTPYARCKQLKALDDFGREESRQRCRLIDKRSDELREIAHLANTQRHLLLLALEETAERDFLVSLERKELTERMTALDRLIVFGALAAHEREERLRIYALAQREGQALIVWSNWVCQLLALQSREVAFRSACVNNEAAARAALISRNVELLNIMDANEKERQTFYDMALEQREQLLVKWSAEREMIQSAMSSDLQRTELIMLERNRFYEYYWKQKQELEVEEREERERLRQRVVEEHRFVVNSLRFRKQKLDDLGQKEKATRSSIIEEEISTRSVLWLESKQSEKEVRNVEQMKCQRRETELSEAIRHLRSIADEEFAAFATIITQERNEKEQRYQWMLDKERQRQKMEQDALHTLHMLCKEEALARSGIMKAMQEAEVDIAAWLQQKTRMLREIVEMAMEQKSSIRLQEHDERFLLVSHKAEQEDAVRRWIDQKEAVRQSVITEETINRAKKVEMEHDAREELVWQFAALLDAFRTFVLEKADQQEKFQQKALQFLRDIEEEESRELILIHQAAQDDKERTIYEENQRQLFTLLSAETERRTYVVQQEVRHRESIFTQLQLMNSFFAKEGQELFKACVCEIVAAEESERSLFLHHIWEAEQRISHEFRQSLQEAREREKERIRMLLRQREISLIEDARVYSEDEVLTFDGGDRVPDKHATLKVSSVDEVHVARRQFVFAELGIQANDATSLTQAGVAFLANMIDLISKLEASAKAKLQHAEAAAREAGEKVAQQRRLLSCAKERLEELKEKLGRDVADHNRRTAMRRETRQKGEAQLERERGRLREKTEELRKMRESVSCMREAIHNKYQKR